MGVLNQTTRRELVAILGNASIFSTRNGRDLLLSGLSRSLTAIIPRSDTTIIDLNNIVSTCDGWEPLAGQPHPLRTLIENAQTVLAGARAADELQSLLLRLWPDATPPVNTPPPQPAALTCRQCGTALEPDTAFCYECGTPVTTTTPPVPRQEQLKAAYAAFLAAVDEVGNPDATNQARALYRALQQEEVDLEYVQGLRAWFRGRRGNVHTAAATFFDTPIVQQILAAALQGS